MRDMFETAFRHTIFFANQRSARWNRRKGSLPVHHQVRDLVWLDQRRFNKHPRFGLQRWIGPMEITDISPGPSYSLHWSGRGIGKAFSYIHPNLIMIFWGEFGIVFIPQESQTLCLWAYEGNCGDNPTNQPLSQH